MRFGIENHPSTYRGAIWLIAGALALAHHRDPSAVSTILGIASAVAGGLGLTTREGPR